VIGCEDRLRNDLYCVEWGVKLYSNQTEPNLDADARWRRGGMHAVASAGLTSNDVTQRELQHALQFPAHHALRRAPAGALQAGAAAMHTGRAGWISFINTCSTHADIRPAAAAAAARTRVKQTANESVPTVIINDTPPFNGPFPGLPR